MLSGQLPDRPPLYDVIRNDAVIEHFSGSVLSPESARDCVIRGSCHFPGCNEALLQTPGVQHRANYRTIRTCENEAALDRVDGARRVRFSTEYPRAKSESTAAPWEWSDDD